MKLLRNEFYVHFMCREEEVPVGAPHLLLPLFLINPFSTKGTFLHQSAENFPPVNVKMILLTIYY